MVESIISCVVVSSLVVNSFGVDFATIGSTVIIIGNVVVHQKGSPQQNELSEIDEDYLYPGNENPISMENYFVKKLGCKMDLKWYVCKCFQTDI